MSYGRRVAAMVLNGLGFMTSRLYMTPHFFEDKPVAQLLGDELTAEHLDSTSFVLYGSYDGEECPPGIAYPTHGYSKANRPDLKQVMLSLVQGGAANIPLWMEALDGNSSDKISFQETVRRVQAFTQSIQGMPDGLCFVVDAAFYVPERLAQLNDVFWITRVPAQLKEAKALLDKPCHELTWETFDANYRGSVYETALSLAKRFDSPSIEHNNDKNCLSWRGT